MSNAIGGDEPHGSFLPMGKADQYLRRAAECIELAKRAKTQIDKQKLLQIAEAWRKLAEEESLLAKEEN